MHVKDRRKVRCHMASQGWKELNVLIFTNKYLNSLKSEIRLIIWKFSSCHTGNKLCLHHKYQSGNCHFTNQWLLCYEGHMEHTQYEQFIVEQGVHTATTVLCTLKHYIRMFLCFVRILASISRRQQVVKVILFKLTAHTVNTWRVSQIQYANLIWKLHPHGFRLSIRSSANTTGLTHSSRVLLIVCSSHISHEGCYQ
jgi:hypothetical protein